MLGVPDPRVIQITLEGLENILKVGQLDVEKNGGINPFAVLIEETFGEYQCGYGGVWCVCGGGCGGVGVCGGIWCVWRWVSMGMGVCGC